MDDGDCAVGWPAFSSSLSHRLPSLSIVSFAAIHCLNYSYRMTVQSGAVGVIAVTEGWLPMIKPMPIVVSVDSDVSKMGA